MTLRLLIILVLVVSSFGISRSQSIKPVELRQTTITFGSCAHEYEPVPAFDAIVDSNPDIFVWLGDMVYGDTHDMSVLKKKYDRLKNKPEYQTLINTIPVIGVWDDHDYGINDGGKNYSKKDESKLLALDFLDAPGTDPRYGHDGLYSSYSMISNEKLIKIILLDTRYFRDTLDPDNEARNKYLPNETGDILGEDQWKWLEKEIADISVDLYIVGSGIQFVAKDHGYEKWANFPAARARMIKLISNANPKSLLFISGDRHMAEVSQMEVSGLPYPLIDFTSSGLTHTWKNFFNEPNEYRVGKLIVEKNFGLIKIAWEGNNPKVTFEVRGINGEEYLKISHTY